MSYLVLARKWRPTTFDEVIGQAHVTQTLKNAIELNRVAHALLFTGSRGIGKTTCARILSKALNCEEGPTTNPCGVCTSCEEISSGRSVDVFEIDGASNNSVEQIREIRESVKFMPARGRRKVYIIDEVHMLSTAAFNALLKTLKNRQRMCCSSLRRLNHTRFPRRFIPAANAMTSSESPAHDRRCTAKHR